MSNVKCPSCGSPNVEQIDVNKYQCPYCGKTFNNQEVQNTTVFQNDSQLQIEPDYDEVDDNPGCFMNGLCFLIPILGLIMYFVKKDMQPNCAKSYITWAAVGFILNFILLFIE